LFSGLLNVIVALLAPMFLWSSGCDVGLACVAASETVNAYRVRDHVSRIKSRQNHRLRACGPQFPQSPDG